MQEEGKRLTKRQIEEYKDLRAAIGRRQQIVATVFLATITTTSILIAYAFSSTVKHGPIFLSPFAIILPSLFFISSQLEGVVRLATYIMVFFEADSEWSGWETRWLKIRQKRLLPYKRKYTFSLSTLYAALSTVSIVLAGLYWDSHWWVYTLAVILIGFAIFLGISYVCRAYGVLPYQKYLEVWTELKESEAKEKESEGKGSLLRRPTSGSEK